MSSINDIVKRLRENRILSERKDYEEYSRDELIKLAQDGDQLAVETLLKTHKDFLERFTKRYFLSFGDEDDLMQLIHLGFWDAVQSWNFKGDDFEAFAGRSIKRTISKELDRESTGNSELRRGSDSLEREVTIGGDTDTATIGDLIPAKGDSAEDVAAASELSDVIEKYLMDNFNAKEREALQMYVEGYKQREIAEVMGMGTKQIENILQKVKGRLRQYLRDRSFMESRKVRRDLEFSDEEKKILESALHNIKTKEIRESRVRHLLEDTTMSIEDTLDAVDAEIEEALEELRWVHYSHRDKILDTLSQLRRKMMSMEDDMDDDQYAYYEELCDKIRKADDVEYEGPEERKEDPYAERGLRQSEFV